MPPRCVMNAREVVDRVVQVLVVKVVLMTVRMVARVVVVQHVLVIAKINAKVLANQDARPLVDTFHDNYDNHEKVRLYYRLYTCMRFIESTRNHPDI